MRSRTEDGPLFGGTANRGRVVRIGETVRRPTGRYTPAVHALLRHLDESGFERAPRVVGVHDDREILGYIEGTAATEPLEGWALTEDALASVGELLREYHDHAAGFGGTALQWQRPVPARWRGSLITHNDLNPANVIFRSGRAAAMIDFDLASPGTAAWDIAVTACFWVPMRAAVDIADRRRDRRVERLRLLLDSYGADAALRRDVASAMTAANEWIARVIEDAANKGHPAFGRLWERAGAVHRRAGHWLSDVSEELGRAGLG